MSYVRPIKREPRQLRRDLAEGVSSPPDHGVWIQYQSLGEGVLRAPPFDLQNDEHRAIVLCTAWNRNLAEVNDLVSSGGNVRIKLHSFFQRAKNADQELFKSAPSDEEFGTLLATARIVVDKLGRLAATDQSNKSKFFAGYILRQLSGLWVIGVDPCPALPPKKGFWQRFFGISAKSGASPV